MSNSENIDVQRLLDDIRLIDDSKFDLMNLMCDIAFDIFPKVQERVMYGGIMFSLDKEDFGGLFARKSHISFEFAAGFLMKDPHEFLEGSGKYRRHLKIRAMEDIVNKNVRFFVKQAVK
jgi:hypothetical protein